MEKLIEFSNKKEVKIYVDTKWLFEQTMGKNMNASDILIKINAIESYFSTERYGMDLYNKMQQVRVGGNLKIEREKANNEEKFISLINSFKENGFNDEYPLELNKDYEVFEGSHRLACALYFNIEKVPVVFNEKLWELKYDYSPNWFKNNGLEEHIMILEKMKEKYKK